MSISRFRPILILFFVTAFLMGCSLTSTSSPSAVQGTSFRGNVHGGQQPIVGAHVYLLSAGTTGYGEPSISLLEAAATGHSDGLGAYVTTAFDGSFSITGDYTCVPGTQAYLYALGGNPGSGINAGSGLLAALGECPASANYLTTTPFVWINEVSTIATAYATAGFATDATHLSSSGTPLAQVGIRNAFANVANLERLSTGVALTTTPGGNGTVPRAEINTLANILASCINSTGAVNGPTNPTACYTLFQTATSDGTPNGVVPSDTATAAINIAHYSAMNTATYFNMSEPSAAFAPALTIPPYDFSMTISFMGGGNSNTASGNVAIDSQGNAWFTDYSATTNVIQNVAKFSPSGVPLSPASGFTNGITSAPSVIAIDTNDNAWILTRLGLVELSNTGTPLPGSPFTGGGFLSPSSMAIDGFNNVWVTGVTTISKFSGAGVPLSPAAGYPVAGVLGLHYIAFDSADNVILIDNTGLVAKLTNTATAVPGFPITIKVIIPSLISLAVDAQNDILVDNSNPGRLYKFTSAGATVTPFPVTIPSGSGGLTVVDGAANVWIDSGRINEVSAAGTVLTPNGFILNGSSSGIALDGSGNVWTSLPAINSIGEMIGASVPVVTPMAAAIKTNMIGVRP